MDISQVIGDFFILRIDESSLSETTAKILRELQPIGVHFGKQAFRHDLGYEGWLDEFFRLRQAICQATGRREMIWALDHEGGRVHRVPEPLTNFPYPLNWEHRSTEVGRAIGKELKSIGINLLFGPSLDIYSEPSNTVIGPRSFGTTAAAVDEFSSQAIAEIEKYGVITAPKHFPGHGDTVEDSHFSLPVLHLTEEQLAQRELLPFTYAINGGTEAIMLAHILFPEIDSQFPATLSPSISRELLREKLHFDGVSLTDDLDMKAIHGSFDPNVIAEQILRGEVNFLVFNHHPDHAMQVAVELQRLLPQHTSQHAAITRRTERFLQRLSTPEVTPLPQKTRSQHHSLALTIGEGNDIAVEEFTGA
ncbi:hypothetical protein MRY87_00905 [bacterium]|nr:hypothetical protein [bacterium]